mmetsp:Transcript_49980/g.150339  ORF Transcript_49980/g.150339 Transcript_49980/m.150339 type:complete len:387 (-) Transcript_49980:393-1553(-)|eukprot:CAMPEP_0113559208 /NCGR_PEP_ID=MMETSP0015_2-20120614/18767_1 /TAXON_ID=2838 /ORGANISM="Odontella" /LENGTH=386 /DNA_ID=CAMNT_0000460815 /DNA_START=179 /DNA_END=1339 /DNA_ORIENTATION=- /assembly_acc=CAM_ASM_000160
MRSEGGVGLFIGLSVLILPVLCPGTTAFSTPSPNHIEISSKSTLFLKHHLTSDEGSGAAEQRSSLQICSRRSVLPKVSGLAFLPVLSSVSNVPPANAAVGGLAEFADANAILQGVTVDVADQSQQDAMIEFLVTGFDFKVLRRRKIGSVTDTWLGFGPEQLSIPEGFTLPVSSFSEYGGHASINIRYDAMTMDAFYKKGDNAPGNNVAYLQVGVPQYRISQMVKNGGNILDAFGIVDVVSPCGLPIRGIIGIRPDPIMFIALNCQDVKVVKSFYEQLGFVEQEYPYARPSNGTGQFEPPQPKNSVYLAPTPNSMGILLLPLDKKKKITPNPVMRTLNVVYTPSQGSDINGAGESMVVQDPSSIGISFTSAGNFEKEEQATSIKRTD